MRKFSAIVNVAKTRRSLPDINYAYANDVSHVPSGFGRRHLGDSIHQWVERCP